MTPKKQMTPAAMARRNERRRVGRPYKKPGPRPPALQEGRDFYCGGCAGHHVVACSECLDGCPDCLGVGKVACPVCAGATVPTQPPEWL